jgi:phosphoribosylaminoimidazole-succinocarboxamide synthase
MPEEVQQHKEQLEGRSILVKKADVIPLEAIVRGYITGEHLSSWTNSATLDTWRRRFLGSAWAEYRKSRTAHGIPLPEGLLESEKLPAPLFTPSTKAEQGAHDENISPERGAVSPSSPNPETIAFPP